MATPPLYPPFDDPARQIRLLYLLPSSDFSAPIEGTLQVISLVRSPSLSSQEHELGQQQDEYTALSYAWGSPSLTTPILLNGHPHHVTLNLASALRHLRHASSSSKKLTLWIDAICINQQDDFEKSHQVAQMGEIYKSADSVIVWLGECEDGDDSHLVAELFLTLSSGSFEDSPFPPPGREADRLLNAGIKFVMNREWWARLWVVQEVLLAKKLEFRFGQWRFEELDVWIGVLGFLVLLGRKTGGNHVVDDGCRPSSLGPGAEITSHENLDVVSSRLAMISLMSEQRKNMVNGEKGFSGLINDDGGEEAVEKGPEHEDETGEGATGGDGLRDESGIVNAAHDLEEEEAHSRAHSEDGQNDRNLPDPMANEDETDEDDGEAEEDELLTISPPRNWTLRSLLESFCERQCTLAQDQVYGLLGVAQDADQYEKPDYSKAPIDVLTQVAIKNLTDETWGLRLLSLAGTSNSSCDKNGLQLPSWVPDWTSRRHNRFAPYTIYAPLVLQKEKPMLAFSPDHRAVRVRGVIHAIVSHVTPTNVSAEGTHLSPNMFFDVDGKPLLYKTGITRLHAVFITLLYDLHMVTGKRLAPGTRSFRDALAAFLYSLGKGLDRGHEERVNDDTTDKYPDYIASFLHWVGQDHRGAQSVEQILDLFLGKELRSDPRLAWKKRKDELTRGQYHYEHCHRVSRILVNSLSGGHLIETENGLFGMASGLVQKGDAVCVLFGCPIPIILRKMGENWVIVQSCYVYGFDEGSSLEARDFNIV